MNFLLYEFFVRRNTGSDNNGGNNVIDKGKRGGPKRHDYEKVIADELGDFDANMSGGGGC